MDAWSIRAQPAHLVIPTEVRIGGRSGGICGFFFHTTNRRFLHYAALRSE